MAFFEKFRYEYATELFHNATTSFRYPDHVLQLRSTKSCPYCGSPLTNVYRRRTEEYDETYVRERHECRGCNWWKTNEYPNNLFNGYFKIGVLHKTRAENDQLILALQHILSNKDRHLRATPKRL
jgi:hypothetical protein